MGIPFDKELITRVMDEMHIPCIGKATIRQTAALAKQIETLTGESFVHLEMGSPGLPAAEIGIRTQIDVISKGIPNVYPNISGIPALKEQASRFIKAFLDIDVAPAGCIASVGSMMGTFATFLLVNQLNPAKDTILFLNPGFSVQPLQAKILGYNRDMFDVYDFRGEKLYEELERRLSKGNVSAIVYSNPNNPSWICFTEDELNTIGSLATKHDTIVVEDPAYLGMDFRKDLSHPFEAPYQSTVARYTDNYILMLSASKIFSYAGERIATIAVSDKLFNRSYPNLKEKYGMDTLGNTLIFTIIYALSSGASHSAQYALAAMYKAACDGMLDFVDASREYARRTARMKKIFLRNGFHIVYDKDLDDDISDGFFFTIGRKGFSGDSLIAELVRFGISAISLGSTGSNQQGIRVCSSPMKEELFPILESRLEAFNATHPLLKESPEFDRCTN